MKRSVNFSKPRQFRLLAELRGSHAKPVGGEVITPENEKRINAMVAFYDSKKHITPAVRLECTKIQFTRSNRNTANVVLESYDAGWRVGKGVDSLIAPDGKEYKPARQWCDLFRYIEYSEREMNK